MEIKITRRFSYDDNSLICEGEYDNLIQAVEEEVCRGIGFYGADFTESDLHSLHVTGGDFRNARFDMSDLTDASFHNCDLTGAVFCGARLVNTFFESCKLDFASMEEALLSNASFDNTDLSKVGATYGMFINAEIFSDTPLKFYPPGHLTLIRDDLWAVLSGAPQEVLGLREALVTGKIDGTTYDGAYDGDCACLVGTLAKVKKVGYQSLPFIKPDASRPAEQWFWKIQEGDTPLNNQFARQALEWIDQWLTLIRSAHRHV